MAQEVDLYDPEDAFFVVEDKIGRVEAFEDQMQVAPVFFGGREEDEDVIDVGDAEREIVEDGVYHQLKGGTSVAKAKTGVVESVGAKGRGDGLQDVVWMHGGLVVALQDVEFGEYLCPMEVGGDFCDVGQRVVVWFRYYVEASIIAIGRNEPSFFVPMWRWEAQGLDAFWQIPLLPCHGRSFWRLAASQELDNGTSRIRSCCDGIWRPLQTFEE